MGGIDGYHQGASGGDRIAENRRAIYGYDRVNRIAARTMVGNTIYTTTLSYLRPESDDPCMSTPLAQSITQNGQNFSYTYDNVGNILSVTRNGLTTTYGYDKLTVFSNKRISEYDDEEV